ncbi:hypothetical protein [uncultured Ralstonia sp.]|jgi:hypothetical protein|uniref:hypothetical protein n=1 Tax=Ralstonia sp. TaxID=54061 RepID=UPI001EAB5A65|nr:hypothetical protein [uncultured Ralstonia sp.]UCF24833.1 MAG: hypothetical protein JSV72_05160 [Ralstonia sp.]
MKRLAALLAFVVAGLLVGCLATRLLIVFIPVCGYDCENEVLGRFFLATGSCLIAFPLTGYLFTRGPRLTLRRVVTVMIVLALTAFCAASCVYVMELREHYVAAEAARPVRPDFDCMHMSIATRDVPAYVQAPDGIGKTPVVIPQWQRCVIGGATCDSKPRQGAMHCKVGRVYVNERDWPAFKLIPQENLMGAEPMKSMRLCAPGNIWEE